MDNPNTDASSQHEEPLKSTEEQNLAEDKPTSEPKLPELNPYQKMAEALRNQLNKVIVGQDNFIELLLVGLLTDGHVLIEGVPGIAKTLAAKLFAKSIDADFSRIQFTPDLMPSDVLGTSVFNAEKAEFEFKAGPIFSNMVLIDEINRAPAKTQSALFEVMEEKQVTIDGHQYDMKPPFMVIATPKPHRTRRHLCPTRSPIRPIYF